MATAATGGPQPLEHLKDSSAEWRVLVLGNDTQLHARPATPIQLIHACLAYGFAFVAPASWGDELVAMRVADDTRSLTGAALLDHCPMVRDAMMNAGSPPHAALRHVAPPAAAARYLRAAFPDRTVHVTYAGTCPGAMAPDVDAVISPDGLARMLLDAGILATGQPVLFDSTFPPDRSRYASEPGGAPNSSWLRAERGALVVGIAPETITPVVRALPPQTCVLLDAAIAVGCNCARARWQLAQMEPPRATQTVVVSDLAGDLGRQDAAQSVTTWPVAAPSEPGDEELDYWVRPIPRPMAVSDLSPLGGQASVGAAPAEFVDEGLPYDEAVVVATDDTIGWFDSALPAPSSGAEEEVFIFPDLSEWSMPRGSETETGGASASASPGIGALQTDAQHPDVPAALSPNMPPVLQPAAFAHGGDAGVTMDQGARTDRFGFAAAEHRAKSAQTLDRSHGRASPAAPRRHWLVYVALGIIGLALGFLTPGLIIPGLRAWLPAWAWGGPPTGKLPLPAVNPDTISLPTVPFQRAASDTDSSSLPRSEHPPDELPLRPAPRDTAGVQRRQDSVRAAHDRRPDLPLPSKPPAQPNDPST